MVIKKNFFMVAYAQWNLTDIFYVDVGNIYLRQQWFWSFLYLSILIGETNIS